MIDLVEAGFDVGVEHPVGAPVGLDPDGLDGHVGRTLRAEPEARGGKVGLEHWLEDNLGRRHHHPVTHGWDTEWPGLTRLARLRDVHPPQWLGPIRLGPQLDGELIEESPHPDDPGLLDDANTHAIDAGGAAVGAHVNPGMEATFGILLGAAIQHALKRSNLVHTLGVADGPSRSLGTHQGSSTPSPAPVKQGPFAPAGLCCPDHRHYYDPLRLPLGCRPLHGAAAYRPARSRPPQGRGRGGPPQFPGQPSDRSTPSHAGRFLRTRSRSEGAFHGLRPVRAGSAPPWPPCGGEQ